MIVTDTSVLAHLIIPSDKTPTARSILSLDRDWCAPVLWASELRSVLRKHLLVGNIDQQEAIDAMRLAYHVMEGGSGRVDDDLVLKLCSSTRCSSYDAEYVAMAMTLAVPLLTWDRKLIKLFPEVAQTPDQFASARS
ncbi:MAG: type II toxin-antitoxin system VapC family toxin [Rhodothermales bacterium]